MEENKILIGCIADDFTGASDAASFLAKSGLRTVLTNGVPRQELLENEFDAVVIALKTRSVPVQEAVESTLRALKWLEEAGTDKFYVKYCSTFDSTPAGNIGPTVDAAMEYLQVPYTVLCPSLPVNGRTVKNGHLYVNGVPLDRSPMKSHPLNPMWSSDISVLMKQQGQFDCLILDSDHLQNARDYFSGKSKQFYIIPDYETDDQGQQIAKEFGDLRLLTGGSGLLEHLAKLSCCDQTASSRYTGTKGRGLALCGSCSQATREQIQRFKQQGGVYYAVDPLKIRTGEQTLNQIWDFIKSNDEPVLVYSIGAEQTKEQREESGGDTAQLLEQMMSRLGEKAITDGFSRIVVAGGETSGAVISALDLDSFYIGPSVAPGVPVMIPVNQPEKRIVLKSGNFGQIDFFVRALEMTME